MQECTGQIDVRAGMCQAADMAGWADPEAQMVLAKHVSEQNICLARRWNEAEVAWHT
jgi:hypothetical protein